MTSRMKAWAPLLCGFLLLSTPGFALEVGDMVSDFTLTDLSDQEVSLSDHAGDIIVLNFFTTWCPGCNEEAGHLQDDIWLHFAGQGVTVIAIDIQEPLSLVQGWAAALGITYPIWMVPDWDLFQEFPGALALPYNAIIAPNMEIRYGAMGFDLSAITSMIETLIDEDQVPTDKSTWGSVKALYHN